MTVSMGSAGARAGIGRKINAETQRRRDAGVGGEKQRRDCLAPNPCPAPLRPCAPALTSAPLRPPSAIANRKSQIANSAGFLLLEVILALAIVAIAVVALLSARNDAMKEAVHAKNLARAALQAEAALEERVLKADWALGASSGKFDDAGTTTWELSFEPLEGLGAGTIELPPERQLVHLIFTVKFPSPYPERGKLVIHRLARTPETPGTLPGG